MAYAELADLKAYLAITDTADDDLLTKLLERAQKAVDSFTGRTFEAVVDTRSFGPEALEGGVLWFDDDLYSVSSVTNGDGDEIDLSEIRFVPRRKPYAGMELRRRSTHTWVFDPDDVAVAGQWGFSVTAPADVVQATIRLAAYMYRQRDTGFEVVRFDDGSIRIPSGMPEDVMQILEQYRRRL